MKRVIWAVVTVVALVLTSAAKCQAGTSCAALGAACPQKAPEAAKTNEREPLGEPNPQADPVPALSATGNVIHIITMECSWKGARWMQIIPWFNGHPDFTRERRYVDDKDPNAIGGLWSETFTVDPGTALAVDCKPMENKKGLVTCKIVDFKTILDFRIKQAGDIRCSGVAGG